MRAAPAGKALQLHCTPTTPAPPAAPLYLPALLLPSPFLPRPPPRPSPCRHPVVATDAFVAPNATVVGRVAVNAQSSVWYGAVVRGDLNTVTIGRYSAIQDRAVVHTAASVEGHVEANTVVGDYVIIGALLWEARWRLPPSPRPCL